MPNVEDYNGAVIEMADDLEEQLEVAEAGLREIADRSTDGVAADVARATLDRLEAMQPQHESVMDEFRRYEQLGLCRFQEYDGAELEL